MDRYVSARAARALEDFGKAFPNPLRARKARKAKLKAQRDFLNEYSGPAKVSSAQALRASQDAAERGLRQARVDTARYLTARNRDISRAVNRAGY